MKNKMRCWPVLFVLGWVCSSVAIAKPPVVLSGKTVITSDVLLFDYNQKMCVFEGNVLAKEPRVQMKSQKLHVFFDASNNVESVVATESVEVTQADRVATCGRAVYTVSSGAITMTQTPKLTSGNGEVAGDKIQIFVNSQKVIATPGASLVVFPTAEKASNDKQQKVSDVPKM